MITRIHYLELIFFSVFIFAVHGMPTRGPEKPQPLKYFATILKEDFSPVLAGVTQGTKQQITGMIKNIDLPGHKNIDLPGHKNIDLPGHKNIDLPDHKKFDIHYNTEKATYGTQDLQVPGYQQMIRVVLQGGTACNKYPCFGWIWLREGSGKDSGVIGSIFSLSIDSNGLQDWDRHSYRKKYRWDTSETVEVLDVEKLGESSIIEFENAQGSWLTKWSTVTELKVKRWKDKNSKLGTLKSAPSRPKSGSRSAQLGTKSAHSGSKPGKQTQNKKAKENHISAKKDADPQSANPSSGHLPPSSESSGHREQYKDPQLKDPKFKFSGYHYASVK
ncbi:hypothetical protein BDP27DRAFT_1424175 [Rhodocollybia butyracea]|uniref:Uncharacterized protein n=1 Tax=Rhodocollybia butyracea TaxID=206335 RepID=A0A9P5PMR1_9AGAR|nr:hypothetical protein BDP27DRAFT_1424175 [Rhodocollybia butyracea]